MNHSLKSKTMIIIISAMTKEHHVIGKDNWLPWNIPEELQLFRQNTIGSTIIMGRKTYDGLGRLMPKRHNIIVSRKPDLKIPGADVCPSIETALELAKKDHTTIFIIGGAEIFKVGIPYADKMYLSFIKQDYTGDTYFPNFNKEEWEIESTKDYPDFEFVILQRKC